MKHLLSVSSALFLATAFAGVPAIESIVSLQGASGKLKVSYTLAGEPAIVTAEILVDGVSLGPITNFEGDVCRLLQPGDCKFFWDASAVPGVGTLPVGSTVVKLTAWPTNSPPDYIVAHLKQPYEVRYYPGAEWVPGGVTNASCKTDYLVMRRIHAAGVTWLMGQSGETDATRKIEHDPRMVTFSSDYYIGIYPVTQGQYENIMGGNPSYYKTDSETYGNHRERPVEQVPWTYWRGSDHEWPQSGHTVDEDHPLGYFRRYTGLEVDLPTSAQWEYACRAGTTTWWFDSTKTSAGDWICDYGWCNGNAASGTHPVGLKKQNPWGLYDLYGNVWEWCLDWYSATSGFWKTAWNGGNALADPAGPADASDADKKRIRRGGDWSNDATACRSARYIGGKQTDGGVTAGARFVCPPMVTK